jgi:hypothetical protein
MFTADDIIIEATLYPVQYGPALARLGLDPATPVRHGALFTFLAQGWPRRLALYHDDGTITVEGVGRVHVVRRQASDWETLADALNGILPACDTTVCDVRDLFA